MSHLIRFYKEILLFAYLKVTERTHTQSYVCVSNDERVQLYCTSCFGIHAVDRNTLQQQNICVKFCAIQNTEWFKLNVHATGVANEKQQESEYTTMTTIMMWMATMMTNVNE